MAYGAGRMSAADR